MSTVDSRLTALESELQAVKDQLARISEHRPWLDEIAGSMDTWPEFEEALQLGREFRRSVCDTPDTATTGD